MTTLSLTFKRTLLRIVTKVFAGRIVTTRDDLKVRIGSDWIMGRVVWHKGYEMRWTTFVSSFLEPGDCSVDVGANFGYYTLTMQKAVGKTGEVHSFEPNPRVLGDLRKNLDLNGCLEDVNLHEVGVGEVTTKAKMDGDDLSSGLGFTRNSESGSIDIQRMDDVLEGDAGKIAFIKMDIEGNEISALRGAEKIISHEDAPLLIIEFNREALERGGAGQAGVFWDLIFGHGYTAYSLDESSRPLEIPKPDANVDEGNYLFVPARGAYRARLDKQ